MVKGELLYSGKAKSVYATDVPGECIMEYRNDLTALNGLKKGSFEGKGSINNRLSNIIFQKLAAQGIPTHLIKEIDEVSVLVKKVKIIPLEVIIRNVAAGSFSQKYGVAEGTSLLSTVLEYSYKNDELNDPMINDSHILALGLATKDQLDKLSALAFKINQCLIQIFEAAGLKLIDFKLEFGITSEGEIVLADEISPDTCRLWDITSGKRLDKDLFRRDLGGYEEAYEELLRRFTFEKAE